MVWNSGVTFRNVCEGVVDQQLTVDLLTTQDGSKTRHSCDAMQK
jgi:hypothetical protein